MFANILVFIISVLVAYGTIYPILRPIICNVYYKPKSPSRTIEIISHVIVDLFIIGIDIAYICLIYFKFNNTLYACILAHILSLFYAIKDCVRDRKALIAQKY